MNETEPPPVDPGKDPPQNENNKFWRESGSCLSSSSDDEMLVDNTSLRKRKQVLSPSPKNGTEKKKVKKGKGNKQPKKKGFSKAALAEIDKRRELASQPGPSTQVSNPGVSHCDPPIESSKDTEDEEGFTLVRTKNQAKRERGSFAAAAPSNPQVRKSAQAVRKQYSFALKTSKVDKKLLSPAAFGSYLKEKLGEENQPDHAQSIGAGTGWILSFSEHTKMSACLEASKSWQEVDLDIAVNKEDSTHPLVVVRVGPHVLEEDFLSVEHVVRASPIRKRNGETVNKWKVSFSSKDARDECLKNGFIIGYFHFETESYIVAPRILQCFRCQKYGHTQKFCDAQKETCFKCARSHRSKECKVTDPRDFRCAVCRGRHIAISPDCPERIRAREATIDRPYAETLDLRHQGVTTPPRPITVPVNPPPRGNPFPVLKPRQSNKVTAPDLTHRSQDKPRLNEKRDAVSQPQRKLTLNTRASHLPSSSTWASKKPASGDLPQLISGIMTKLMEFFNSTDRSSPERIMSLIFSLWPTVKSLLDLVFPQVSATATATDLTSDYDYEA